MCGNKSIANEFKVEPKEAFIYRAPTKEMLNRYKYMFEFKEPLESRYLKICFDKIISLLLLLITFPIFLTLICMYLIEGLFLSESRGSFFVKYKAVSQGIIFWKYKFRVIKTCCIDTSAASRGDWHAFSAEWNPKSRTHVGAFVKKFYLDELPQLYNILRGDMSFVGPRPLAKHHYDRDIDQGNIFRKLVKAGLLGQGHIRKGTPEMGNPKYDFDYVEKYINLSAVSLLIVDLLIIAKGIVVVIKGKGL